MSGFEEIGYWTEKANALKWISFALKWQMGSSKLSLNHGPKYNSLNPIPIQM